MIDSILHRVKQPTHHSAVIHIPLIKLGICRSRFFHSAIEPTGLPFSTNEETKRMRPCGKVLPIQIDTGNSLGRSVLTLLRQGKVRMGMRPNILVSVGHGDEGIRLICLMNQTKINQQKKGHWIEKQRLPKQTGSLREEKESTKKL